MKSISHGRRSERRVAKQLGARGIPASGGGSKWTPRSGPMPAAIRGDSLLPGYLIESKATVNASLSVKWAWLEKITKAALARGRDPALSLSFVTATGDARPGGDWIAIPARVFRSLVEGDV